MVGKRLGFDVSDMGGRERLLVEFGKGSKQGVIEGVIGGKKQEPQKVVWMPIVGFPLPLALKTNHCKELVQIYGTGEVLDWEGKWVWLTRELVNDPSRGSGAKTEAVRVLPKLPSKAEIEEAIAARGGKKAPPATTRDDAADQRLIGAVCGAIEAAKTEEEIEAAIAPHREEIKKMEKRLQAVVASTKTAHLATLEQAPPAPTTEGTPTDAA